MGTEVERRVLSFHELRVVGKKGQPHKLAGYAAVFNVLSVDLGGFREMINPGAFSQTIKEADVRALWNHDRNMVLGRTGNGTLSLKEDKRGLHFEVLLPDTQWAKDALISVRRGDVTGASFGFDTVRDEWTQEGNQVTRTLVEVKLYDISPATFPAYPQTSAEVRTKVGKLRQVTTAPVQVGHPVGAGTRGLQWQLDLRRRRLDLAELEAGIDTRLGR